MSPFRRRGSCVVGSFAALAFALLLYLSVGDIGGFSVNDGVIAEGAVQNRHRMGHLAHVDAQALHDENTRMPDGDKKSLNDLLINHSKYPQLLPSSSSSAACIRRLHENVGHWLACIDPAVPAAAGSTKWLNNNICNFVDVTSFDAPLVARLFLSNVVEAHGDSTLREVVKLLIGGLRMEGTLDKKDASSTLRYPKYFTRLWSNCSFSDTVSAEPKQGSNHGGKMEETALSMTVPSTVDTGRSACHARWCPSAFRVMFRFDFVPSSFNDPLGDSVPTLPVAPSVGCTSHAAADRSSAEERRRHSYRFFDGIPSHRMLLLATGSHTAKLLLMNQSTHAYANKLTQRNAFSDDELFKLIVADVEAYIIRRILGLLVVRDSSARVSMLLQEAGGDASSAKVDATHEPVDYVVLMLETLECESMAEAKLSGFREMSVHCASIKLLVHRINEELDRHFSGWGPAGGGNEALPPSQPGFATRSTHSHRRPWHKHSALHALTPNQLATVQQRVFVVPPLACHSGRFQFTASKPYCTRDGIHLRTKFIRQKVNLLLNVFRGIEACEH